MAINTVYSGNDGTVSAGGTDIAQITAWKAEFKAANPSWASSTTGGIKTRAKGVKDLTGSFDFVQDGTQLHSAITEGEEYALILTMSSGHALTGTGIIESISVDVNVDAGDVVKGTATFGEVTAFVVT